MERKDTTLPVKKTTKTEVDEFKSPGQSYDGAIRELLKQVKQEVEA